MDDALPRSEHLIFTQQTSAIRCPYLALIADWFAARCLLAEEPSSMRGAKRSVSTGPSVAVVSTSTRTTLNIRWSMSRWCRRSNVLKATSVAASVAATCGNVSDHIVIRAADVYLNALPTISAAIHLPAMSATMIADASVKLSIMVWTNTTGSIKNPVAQKKIGMNKEFPKNSSFSFAGLS